MNVGRRTGITLIVTGATSASPWAHWEGGLADCTSWRVEEYYTSYSVALYYSVHYCVDGSMSSGYGYTAGAAAEYG